MKQLSLLVLVAALASSILAQQVSPPPIPQPQPQPQPQKPDDIDVVRITTNLVQVDISVTKDGKPVTDLQPEDFEIFEDGKPQTITNFSYVSNVPGNAPPAPLAAKSNDKTASPIAPAKINLNDQRRTIALVEFLIDKTKLLDHLKGKLNVRQDKALLRMFREDPDGFKGGLSAGKYSNMTGASPATTTRDLADLVAKAVLVRDGERRYARYRLSVPLRPVRHLTLNDQGELIES